MAALEAKRRHKLEDGRGCGGGLEQVHKHGG
jgi:hypothetical protein